MNNLFRVRMVLLMLRAHRTMFELEHADNILELSVDLSKQ